MDHFLSLKSITLLFSGVLLSAAACFALISFGHKYGILPRESFRRQKEERIPLLGGMGIYLSSLVINFFCNDMVLWKLLIAGLPLVIIGTWDDIREISARFKFGAQCTSALLWIILAAPNEIIYTKITGSVVFGVLLTFLFIITLENAFNFLDGSDGLVGILSIITFIAVGLSSTVIWPAAILLAAGVFGFLCFNLPPAKLYLGEVGSSFLGFSTAALATLAPINEKPWVTFWAINFIFSLPFCDLLIAVVRRAIKRLAPWSADKEHFHHKLAAIGMTKKMVLLMVLFMASTASVTGYTFMTYTGSGDILKVFGFVSGTCLTFIYFSFHVAEKIWGRRVSVFGRQIIEKYLAVDLKPIQEFEQFKCVVVDLMPYFSEIQSRGIADVEKFAFDFGQWASRVENLRHIKLVGSYSVAVIVEPAKGNNFVWRSNIKNDLQKIFINHRALRNLKVNPEGLYFYENLADEAVRRLLNLNDLSPSQIKKSAS